MTPQEDRQIRIDTYWLLRKCLVNESDMVGEPKDWPREEKLRLLLLTKFRILLGGGQMTDAIYLGLGLMAYIKEYMPQMLEEDGLHQLPSLVALLVGPDPTKADA